jgi:hypothetical protein
MMQDLTFTAVMALGVRAHALGFLNIYLSLPLPLSLSFPFLSLSLSSQVNGPTMWDSLPEVFFLFYVLLGSVTSVSTCWSSRAVGGRTFFFAPIFFSAARALFIPGNNNCCFNFPFFYLGRNFLAATTAEAIFFLRSVFFAAAAAASVVCADENRALPLFWLPMMA